MTPADAALVELGRALRALDYRFVAPTPETHRRVLARGPEEAASVRDVFGWSKPFRRGLLPPPLEDLLERAGGLVSEGSRLRSGVRFATLGGLLCVHSAFPTLAVDSVFFGPDTYRFARLLEERVAGARSLVDVGCGSGAGGLLLAPRVDRVQLLDVNPAALRAAAVNAALAGIDPRIAASDVLAGAEGALDLVIANPPYLADEAGRTYRDGGGALGTGLSLRIVRESLARLQPGGRLLLYTASPVIDGRHVLLEGLEPLLEGTRWEYGELDPDVFGEELDRPAYARAGVERFAVVALDAVKP